MSSFYLKILACITMLLDHIAILFTPIQYPLTYIGRIAFPLFAFQCSVGVEHTKNIKKYILRLFIFALISQIPFALYFKNGALNVMFTLLFGVVGIVLYEFFTKKHMQPFAFLTIALLGYLAEFLNFDYGVFGVFLIFLFYFTQNNLTFRIISYILLTSIFYISKILLTPSSIYTYQLLFALLTIIIILLYNGKQGKKIKYAIYIFYPLHILVLYFIQLALKA